MVAREGCTTENDLASPRKQTTSGIPRSICPTSDKGRLRSKTTRSGFAILPYLNFKHKYTFNDHQPSYIWYEHEVPIKATRTALLRIIQSHGLNCTVYSRTGQGAFPVSIHAHCTLYNAQCTMHMPMDQYHS